MERHASRHVTTLTAFSAHSKMNREGEEQMLIEKQRQVNVQCTNDRSKKNGHSLKWDHFNVPVLNVSSEIIINTCNNVSREKI